MRQAVADATAVVRRVAADRYVSQASPPRWSRVRSAQKVGQVPLKYHRTKQAADQQRGRSQVLAAHDLPLFAGLLAAIGGRFVRLVAKSSAAIGQRGERDASAFR